MNLKNAPRANENASAGATPTMLPDLDWRLAKLGEGPELGISMVQDLKSRCFLPSCEIVQPETDKRAQQLGERSFKRLQCAEGPAVNVVIVMQASRNAGPGITILDKHGPDIISEGLCILC